MSKCIICGNEIVDGKCPNQDNHFKKMCLNCSFCVDGACHNSENMEIVRNKVIASVPNGYEIEELKLKPVALSEPTRKCNKYSVDNQRVIDILLSFAE